MAKQTKDPSKAYLTVLRRQRATLDRLMDRRGVLALRRYYDKAQDELERRLHRMARETRTDPLSPLQAQQLLAEVYAAQQAIALRLHSLYVPVMEEAQIAGVDETDYAITRLEEQLADRTLDLPLTDETVRRGIIDGRRFSLREGNKTSFQKFGQNLSLTARQQMSVSLALGETATEAIDRLRQSSDDEWWQGERIVATESAKAFNSAHADSIELVGRDLRDMMKRWTELVDDRTGSPLDSRVGIDSMVLHGQVTAMDGVFVMPPDPRIKPRYWNNRWASSPNRPNDRSITMPWRPGWGVPGWEWKDGQRVDLEVSASGD